MAFLGDIGLDQAYPEFFFMGEQHAMLSNLDPQQILGFGIRAGSPETSGFGSWSQETICNRLNEE